MHGLSNFSKFKYFMCHKFHLLKLINVMMSKGFGKVVDFLMRIFSPFPTLDSQSFHWRYWSHYVTLRYLKVNQSLSDVRSANRTSNQNGWKMERKLLLQITWAFLLKTETTVWRFHLLFWMTRPSTRALWLTWRHLLSSLSKVNSNLLYDWC